MWARIKKFFKDSEVIFYARLNVLGGLFLAVFPTLNPVAWLDAALTTGQRLTMAATAIINGVITEVLRKRRDPEMKQ